MVTKPSKLAITISIFRKWIRHFDHCFHFVSRFLFVFGCFANVSVLISHIVVHFVFKYLFRLRLHLIGKIDGVHSTLYKWVRSCCFFFCFIQMKQFLFIFWWFWSLGGVYKIVYVVISVKRKVKAVKNCRKIDFCGEFATWAKFPYSKMPFEMKSSLKFLILIPHINRIYYYKTLTFL